MLERAVHGAPAVGGRPGLLDAQPRLGERRAVDSLHGERSQPIVAAGQVKGRRRGRRRELVAEPHRIGLDHRAGAGRAVRRSLADSHRRRGSCGLLGLAPEQERLATAADRSIGRRGVRATAGRCGLRSETVRRAGRPAGRAHSSPITVRYVCCGQRSEEPSSQRATLNRAASGAARRKPRVPSSPAASAPACRAVRFRFQSDRQSESASAAQA